MNEFKERLKIISSKFNGSKFPTIYNIYDKNHDQIGYINSKYEKMQNRYLDGICMFLETENGKIVMERRGNTTLNPYEDDFCSGHVENNETYMQAAYREGKEELGLNENEITNLTHILEPIELSFKGRKFFIQFFYGKINSNSIKIDNKEVSKYYEEELEESIKKLIQDKTKFEYNSNKEGLNRVINQLQREVSNVRKKEQVTNKILKLETICNNNQNKGEDR